MATWNILSQALTNKSVFPDASVQALDEEHRLDAILWILSSMIKERCIICLQEVSCKYKVALTMFFIQNGYTFICENYGNSWSDFMGVGVAFPNEWTMIDYEIIIPSSLAWHNLVPYRPPRETRITYHPITQGVMYAGSTLWGCLRWLLQTVRILSRSSPPIESMITRINKVYNRFPMVRLEKDGCELNIMPVHMPCKFEDPELGSAIYASMVRSLPRIRLIMAGDFNAKISSDVYNLITTGRSSFPRIGHSLNDVRHTGLFDSYFMQRSPSGVLDSHYTYYSHTRMFGVDKTFKDTIDYVFASPDIECTEHVTFPQNDILMPNEDHPSDHSYIIATLDIPETTNNCSAERDVNGSGVRELAGR